MPRPDLFGRGMTSWQFALEASRLIANAVRQAEEPNVQMRDRHQQSDNDSIMCCHLLCLLRILSLVKCHLTCEAKSSMIPYMQDTIPMMLDFLLGWGVYLGTPIIVPKSPFRPSYVCECGVG